MRAEMTADERELGAKAYEIIKLHLLDSPILSAQLADEVWNLTGKSTEGIKYETFKRRGREYAALAKRLHKENPTAYPFSVESSPHGTYMGYTREDRIAGTEYMHQLALQLLVTAHAKERDPKQVSTGV